MARNPRTVHVAKITDTHKRGTYTSYSLRRTSRQDGKVQHETLGNLSDLPPHVIDPICRSLQGETFVPAADAFQITRSLPHGHVQAVLARIKQLDLASLIASRPSRERDSVLALVAERLLSPGAKLATTRHRLDTTLAEGLHVQDAEQQELYAARDWRLGRQKAGEIKLARRHLAEGGLVLDDVRSSYDEGETCPLPRDGPDRDGSTGAADHRLGRPDRCPGASWGGAGRSRQHRRADHRARSGRPIGQPARPLAECPGR